MGLSLADAIGLVVEYIEENLDIETDSSDWTKVQETTVNVTYGEKVEYFELSHDEIGTMHVVCPEGCDKEDAVILEDDTLLYDIGDDPQLTPNNLYLVFCPQSYWERNGHIISDTLHEHQGAALMAAFNLPRNIAENEMMEGAFGAPSNLDVAGIHSLLQSLGYQYRDMNISTPQQLQQQANPIAQTPVRTVLAQAIQLFDADDPITTGNEIHLGDIIEQVIAPLPRVDQDALRPDIWSLLQHYGIPSADVTVFDAGDRHQILKRIIKAANDESARYPGGQSGMRFQSKPADTRPAVDVTGKKMDELYRLAIRGEIPQIKAIGWKWAKEGEGPATQDEIAWFCGYVDSNDRLMQDLVIPDHVFERWFPEYKQITWNDYEKEGMTNYHTMPSPAEQYVDGFKSIIASRYADKGIVHLEDLTDAPDVPLMPKSSRPAVGAPTLATPVHAASNVSDIRTLKAWPPGHTGNAPLVAATVQEAPHTTSTEADPSTLWREYQADMNALAEHGIQRAGYQIVNTTPQIVFAVGFLDEKGGVVETIPTDEVLTLFPEYNIRCLDDGITYQINKLLGQQLSELADVVKERLSDVKIFDVLA